ncbi:MAG TPA: Sec-independent protein translocase protein TatB [bacterium]
MFGIGMSEFLVILIIGLVVVGPKQLPEVARTLGKLFAQFKRTTNDLKEQVDREVRQFSEMEEVKEFRRSMEDEMNGVKSAAEEMKTQAEDYVKKEIEETERLARLEDDPSHSGPNNGDAGMLSSDAATASTTDTEKTAASNSSEASGATADSVQYSPNRMPDGGLPPGKLPS